MKITKITQQVKHQGRYSIFVDDKYAFSLSDRALLESKLYKGQEIDGQQLSDYKQTSKNDKAYDMALRYIGLRPRSRWEMETYLKRKGLDPLPAQAILDKLSISGLLDDTEFARLWIANRRLLRPTSVRKLQQELRAKRVEDSVIKQVLDEDETDERQVLRELVTKKRRQSRYQDNTKLMQYLARQGYSYDDIKAVLQDEDAA